MAVATSSTSAPVASQSALIELMLLILWARKAFAALKIKKKKYNELKQQFYTSGLYFIQLMQITEGNIKVTDGLNLRRQ